MKEGVLIIGGSKGIGLECAQLLESDYHVQTSSRSAGTWQGDITNPDFRKELADSFKGSIVIGCAGVHDSKAPLAEILMTNFIPYMDLVDQFQKIGRVKKFVVISSASAHFTVGPRGIESVSYAISKKCLSQAFVQLQLCGRYKMKFIVLEPGVVNTDFAQMRERSKRRHPDDFITRLNIDPIDPKHIAQTVQWALAQPSNLVPVLISQFNHYS